MCLKVCDKCGIESKYITVCTYSDDDKTLNLCPTCLKEDGSFCLSCGDFCIGMFSFDFIHPGYCDACWEEIEDLDHLNEEEDEDYDPYDDDEFPKGSLDY